MAGVPAGADDPQLSFPLPPTYYYKHYTDENVKKGTVPSPPKVVTGEYTLFGHLFKTDDDVIQPLESQGIKRLYSKEENFDHIVEMKKLNHSILVNYMELLDVMIDAPASAERQKKIEEIKILFINLHHLINEFRPHQARETLRIMLHRQKQTRLETSERLKKNIEKARGILKNCSANLQNSLAGSAVTVPTETTKVQPDTTDVSRDLNELRLLQNKIMCDISDSMS